MVHNLGGRATTFVAAGGWKDKLVEVLVSEQLEKWRKDRQAELSFVVEYSVTPPIFNSYFQFYSC